MVGRAGFEPAKAEPADLQAFGSALTYARRYALASVVGLTADEDDDGNEASKNPLPVKAPVLQESLNGEVQLIGTILEVREATGEKNGKP